MRRRERERQEKREDRPIYRGMLATLLRLFRGLHSEKMICVRGVLGEAGTLRKANSHLNPTQTNWSWGLHHHVEAAVDWCSSI